MKSSSSPWTSRGWEQSRPDRLDPWSIILREPETASPEERPRPFILKEIRADFPALRQEVHPGVPLAYLDSAATALKPWPVIRAVEEYFADYPANVHRGLHALSDRATEEYELARDRVAQFLNAPDSSQIIFTRGTTEAINLVAQSWARTFLKPGDEIVLNLLEHHSNLVPWQMLAEQTGAVLRFADITDSGRLDFLSFARHLSGRTRLVAISAMSNVLGTVPPLQEVIDLAHEHGALVLVDAAQAAAHLALDVVELGCDFLAFSGHKVYGPTGVGVLYGKRALLEAMPPWMGGGGMIVRVDRQASEWNELPWKFEAGTPPIAEAIGLGVALDYLGKFDPADVLAHERRLTLHAHQVLPGVPGLRLLGPEPYEKGPIASFVVDGLHPHDLAQLVDRSGVAVRAGHHCTMPLHRRLGLAATARASFGIYNTTDEIDLLARSLVKAQRVIGRRPKRQGAAESEQAQA